MLRKVGHHKQVSIRIWDLKTLKCLRIFQGHKNIIESVIQIKNKFYSCSHDKEIKIWNLAAKKNGFLKAEEKNENKEKNKETFVLICKINIPCKLHDEK